VLLQSNFGEMVLYPYVKF